MKSKGVATNEISLASPSTYNYLLSRITLLHDLFLQFDWLRAVVFQLDLKYLHVKITNLLWVVVETNNTMICM